MSVSYRSGFTVIELLITIVVIAILAAITTVAYMGMQTRATETAIGADLRSAASQLELSNAENGKYPENESSVNGGNGLGAGSDVGYQYSSNGSAYCLTGTSTRANASTFHISSETKRVQAGACPGHSSENSGGIIAGYEQAPVTSGGSISIGGYNAVQPASCPSSGGAWVKVPGNTLYGLANGFCVQQYPASNVSGVATSQASGNRWTALNRPAAVAAAMTADGGTHLLNDNEWMTIATNAAMQSTNWSGGSVGSGTLPTGSSSSSRGSFFITLSNGERIYFDTGAASYNTYVEFTCYSGANAQNCGIPANAQPSPANAFHIDQLPSYISSYGSLEANNQYFYGDPRFANPTLDAYVNSSRNKGLGYLRTTYSSSSSTIYNLTRGFWNGASTSGLFSLQFLTAETYAHASYGFRAAK